MAARKTDSNLLKGNQRKVAKGVEDAYFRNASRHPKTGELQPLVCGIVNFKPGEVRFVTAQAQMRSGNGFANAVKLGWLLGPAKSEAELGVDLDLEENPETEDRMPELPGADDEPLQTTATDQAKEEAPETVPVGGDPEPDPATMPPPSVEQPPAEEPPASVEPPPAEEPPASVENAPEEPKKLSKEDVKAAKKAMLAEGRKELEESAEEPEAEPKKLSAKDLLTGKKKKSSKKKG